MAYISTFALHHLTNFHLQDTFVSSLWRLIQRLRPSAYGSAGSAGPAAGAAAGGNEFEGETEEQERKRLEKKARFPGLAKPNTAPLPIDDPTEVCIVMEHFSALCVMEFCVSG